MTSLTLGPNSKSFKHDDNNKSSSTNCSDIHNKLQKSPVEPSNSRKSFDGNRLDISGLRIMQSSILERSEERRINSETIKKLEEVFILKEEALHKKIQNEIQQMRVEAESRHKMRTEQLEKQIQNELKLEYEKEQQYLNQRRALAANSRKILEEQEKQLEILRENLRRLDETFSKQESIFIKTLQTCTPDMAAIIDNYKKQHKDIKNIREACKSSVEGMKNVLAKLENLTQNFIKEKTEFENLLKARQAAAAQKELEEKQKAAEAAAAAEEASKQAILNQQQQQQQPQIVDENTSQNEHFKQYSECRKLLATKKSQTKVLDETPELQQIRFALKFAVNNSINLLNEKNKNTLIDGFQKLINLLSGQRISTAKGNVAITDHNEAADFCRLRIAEKIIDRCDKEPGLIFYAAALAIALWQKYPDFGEIFMALLYKECPFLMPFKPPMLKNQSNDDFLQSWGFRLVDGKCESHTNYTSRTTNFAALLSALWITQPRRGESANPFDIENGWRFLASVLNTTPDTNFLHILGRVLEIAGSTLHQIYGRQFVKLMMTIRDFYLPAVHNNVDEETGASFNRLRDMIAKFFTENKFEEPKGKLMPGYW